MIACTRGGATALAVAALVALAGCATAAPATSPSPSAEQSASASPQPSASASAEPGETPSDPTADWIREDLGWATIPVPGGWSVEQRGDAEWMVVSDRGLDMVTVFRVPEGQYAQDFACLPEDLPAFEAVETLPFGGAQGATADAWTSAGTAVEVGTTIRDLQIADGTTEYAVQMGVTEAPNLAAESCEPFFVVTPADGIPSGIFVVEDPPGGLQFASRDDALAYLDTDEHETLTDLLLGIRLR